jgi:hypothetical protein
MISKVDKTKLRVIGLGDTTRRDRSVGPRAVDFGGEGRGFAPGNPFSPAIPRAGQEVVAKMIAEI